ncbi:hypothetical protein DFP72DRAFT_1181496 [Ephemerocybe angulata]|uniref:Uncharacterized protein n=1 Tax=Ephemerocybe angulata TaxID=980116 RepID=A0A8H6LU77_9AGAR|nr:hypothetical protein DFP72DRAFT_1181496 [Tulosesus angulatus]
MKKVDLTSYPDISESSTFPNSPGPSPLLAQPSSYEETWVYVLSNDWDSSLESLWRIPVEDVASTSSRSASAAATKAVEEKHLHPGIRAVLISPKFAEYFFIDATSKAAVDALLPDGAKEKYLPCPPFLKALDESTSYGLSYGQWFLFVGKDAAGRDYLALGLSKHFDRKAGVVTAYTLPNSGRELFLFLGKNRQEYLRNSRGDVISSGSTAWVPLTASTELLRFDHGLQVVTVPASETAIPTREPPSALVELIQTALAASNTTLLDASLKDLMRFRPQALYSGARCKITRGAFAGTAGTIYPYDAPDTALTRRGYLRVLIPWKGQKWIVPQPPSFTTRAFEVGDLVSGESVDGQRARGWIADIDSSKAIYKVRCFDTGRLVRLRADEMGDWTPDN